MIDFSLFGKYADIVKWTIYLAIITLVLNLLRNIYVIWEDGIRAEIYLEVAEEKAQQASKNWRAIQALKKEETNTPLVDETAETIREIIYIDRFVDRFIDRPVPINVCDDLGVTLIGVLNDIQDCAYTSRRSLNECLDNRIIEFSGLGNDTLQPPNESRINENREAR